MVPDADLQLAVVIKALREVVAPAIDPANRLAAEQLHLSIATLGLVQSRLPMARRRVRRELINALELAEGVLAADAATGLAQAIGSARAVLDDPRADDGELERVRAGLLDLVEAAVDATSGTASEQAIARAVIAGSRAQFDLARAWCLPAGFEPDAGALPPLEKLLAE